MSFGSCHLIRPALNYTTTDDEEKTKKNDFLLPDTGAVFAFGRSHLTISGDGNDNNYFFIKKDRIKRLICGRSQSAVICGNVDKNHHKVVLLITI